MLRKTIFAVIVVLSTALASTAGWELVWSDEFDYTGLPDKTKWGYDAGTGSNGWGNNELEYYTKDSLKNARAENGTLIITARKEQLAQSKYTSARLVTLNKGDWLYGRFEIAAKLPKGVGLWPAIWMLPSKRVYGDWPKSGELDIMENVGFDSMKVHFNIHTEAYNHTIGTNKGATVTLDDPHTKFNVYALEWYEDSVVFFVNDKKAFLFKNEHTGSATWPYDQQFHLLLNIAVGGSWGGQNGVDDAIFPREMVIDYVRVYKHTATGVKSSRLAPSSSRALSIDNNELTIFRSGTLVVTLFSINGKTVFASAVDSKTSCCRIPCRLPQGTYVAVVNDGTGRYVQQVVNSN